MSHNKEITKENVNEYLFELAKAYKKINKHAPEAEIIIVGGASILLNYNFREMTTDIDAMICATSAFKDAINSVTDKYNLPNDWINTDFTKTLSYSDKLREHSKFYKTFCNKLSVRLISDEYLIAMKLKAGREYKKDMSDIVGIIKSMKDAGKDISFEKINKAVIDLYDNWNGIDPTMKQILNNALISNNLEQYLKNVKQIEYANNDALLNAMTEYKNEINTDNVNEFISHFARKSNPIRSISEEIRIATEKAKLHNQSIAYKKSKNKDDFIL